MSYYKQLLSFLSQAKTDNLKTKHFDSNYLNTSVKVSFGQGMPARIPWISFLIEPNTTSNGIYPVYLYYKNEQLLILAYGLSESNEPDLSWSLKNGINISKYFKDHKLSKPTRYGSSFVFKVYDVNNLPTEDIINNDLEEIIEKYKKTMTRNLMNEPEPQLEINNSFIKDLILSNLIYDNELITRFISSLITKSFVILTGLSGSGKTKLAQAFVEWICEDDNQFKIVPVGADWTNREPLLGFPDALNSNNYVLPESGALQLIIEASKKENENKPYFLILDEMNLSQVERYFADFLSVMESKDQIKLHSNPDKLSEVPKDIKLPQNLFIIGTVNIDETTYMFSPKVLDRANTIEFRVRKGDLKKFFNNGAKGIHLDTIRAQGSTMANDFLTLSNNTDLTKTESELTETLLQFFNELKENGAEYGYRSAYEILLLIQNLGIIGPALSDDKKLDIAIMQKLLPKLHGGRRKIIPVLEKLGELCLIEGHKFEDALKEGEENNPKAKYPLSFEKIARMHKRAIDNGYTSFAEA